MKIDFKWLGTGFLRVSLETAQTPAELFGTARHWSNSQLSSLFGVFANVRSPIPSCSWTKSTGAGGDVNHRSDAALYALLEPNTVLRRRGAADDPMGLRSEI